ALAGLRHPALAQEHNGVLDVSSGLDERSLAFHHPGASPVAQLLHERRGDLGLVWVRRSTHAVSPPSTASATATGSATSVASSSASGSGSAATGSGVAAGAGAANSFSLTFERPASMPSAIARTTRLQERIASSLPGMTKSASSGSQFVST